MLVVHIYGPPLILTKYVFRRREDISCRLAFAWTFIRQIKYGYVFLNTSIACWNNFHFRFSSISFFWLSQLTTLLINIILTGVMIQKGASFSLQGIYNENKVHQQFFFAQYTRKSVTVQCSFRKYYVERRSVRIFYLTFTRTVRLLLNEDLEAMLISTASRGVQYL